MHTLLGMLNARSSRHACCTVVKELASEVLPLLGTECVLWLSVPSELWTLDGKDDVVQANGGHARGIGQGAQLAPARCLCRCRRQGRCSLHDADCICMLRRCCHPRNLLLTHTIPVNTCCVTCGFSPCLMCSIEASPRSNDGDGRHDCNLRRRSREAERGQSTLLLTK